HTRSKRDWSSDVCSSDLIGKGICYPSGPHASVAAGRDYRRFGDLSRMRGDLENAREAYVIAEGILAGQQDADGELGKLLTSKARSEEHTSELQSRFDLVC